jgi:hypothetical protein
MRSVSRWLIVGLVAALVAISASPAAAKKGDKGPPDRPADDPIGGYTCVEKGQFPAWEVGLGYFTFELDATTPTVCVDVWSDWPGEWDVLIEGSGARGISLILRDSFSPGDGCAALNLGRDDMYGQHSLLEPVSGSTIAASVPASTVNACGTAYGEWIDGSIEIEQTGEPHPLALVVSMRKSGKTGGTATVRIDLPEGP